MGVPRLRESVLVAALAVLPVGLAGCGFGDDGSGATAEIDEGPIKSRERVRSYLDAMKAKDVAAGRAQLCAVLHEAFGKGSTGPNGDFAAHFTVSEAIITDVRANRGNQEVSTTITVDASGRTIPINILFTVSPNNGEWCIADETVGGNTPSPVATPTAGQ